MHQRLKRRERAALGADKSYPWEALARGPRAEQAAPRLAEPARRGGARRSRLAASRKKRKLGEKVLAGMRQDLPRADAS